MASSIARLRATAGSHAHKGRGYRNIPYEKARDRWRQISPGCRCRRPL